MKQAILLMLFPVLLICRYGRAQQFSAFSGSIYGASINTFSQPASGANMPYRWDVEVAGANVFWNNNIFSFAPTKWNWRQDSLGPHGHFIPGDKKRWGAVQGDIHLVNFLIRLPRHTDWVVGAGWNFHSRTWPGNMDFLYSDSLHTLEDFLEANAFNKLQHGVAVDQQWTEWYLTASRIITDNRRERFTAGATLKLMKGLSAAVVDLSGLSVGFNPATGKNLVFTSATGRFGYSGNLGDLDDNTGSSNVAGTLLNGSPLSPGLDFGITYTRKTQAIIPGFGSDDPAAYDWKLEASLTDLGRIKYPLGDLSTIVTGLQGNPGVNRFARMMDSVETLSQLKDSLAQIALLQPWSGGVSISLPTALRINFDKSLGSHLYVNAQLALDMSFLNPGVDYRIHQLSQLTVTPRWEITRIGVYAPLYINSHGSFMAGAAIRLGPLVAGVHDFGWLFHASNRGGAYVGLVIRGLYKEKSECPVF